MECEKIVRATLRLPPFFCCCPDVSPQPTQKWPQTYLFLSSKQPRKQMTFKSTGRFIPDRHKSDPKSTFSRPVSLPQNEWCSHPKPKKTFLDQITSTIWFLMCQIQDKSTRYQIDSYVRSFASGRTAGRARSKFSRISKVPTACVKSIK